MKKIILFFVIALISYDVNAQIKVGSTGNVGIGTMSPTYKLDVVGTTQFVGNIRFVTTGCTYNDVLLFDNTGLYCKPTLRPAVDWSAHLGTSAYRFGDVFSHHVITKNLTIDSDEKIKKNISEINNTIEKIKKIKSVTYDYAGQFENTPDQLLKKESKKEIGFLAQNLLEVYPELVTDREDIGHYTVNYIGMIPILLSAIKEQQVLIEELQRNVNKGVVNTGINNNSDINSNLLFQNNPNPFNEETVIKFNLSENSTNVSINIYDLNGKQIKKYSIQDTNQKSIKIYSSDLYPGIFYYSLIVDGKDVDTKKLILTE